MDMVESVQRVYCAIRIH